MNKNPIKVVKSNKKSEAEKTQPEIISSTVEKDAQIEMIDVINNWISERRENSRLEKTFSDDKILGWKLIP
jgi:hypothetical protein